MAHTLNDAARAIEGAIAKAGEVRMSIAVTVCNAGVRMIAGPSGMMGMLVSPFVHRPIGRRDGCWLAAASFAAFAVSYFARAVHCKRQFLGHLWVRHR